MNINNKDAIRQHYKKIRAALSESRKIVAKSNAFNVLGKLVINYNNVLSFTSKKDELDLSELNSFLVHEKRLFLPKAIASFLKIYHVQDLSSLIMNNHYFILEPDDQKCELVDPKEIDLVLVPGVAFDNQKNRIGFGKAYYDKLLANMPKAIKIGVGYKEQLSMENLPIEAHDIQLNDIYLF